MSTEYIDISECPKCKERHRYKLIVERSLIMNMMTANISIEPEQKVHITRLFTCPEKNEEFQAKFVLSNTSSNRIKNVSVLGIANNVE